MNARRPMGLITGMSFEEYLAVDAVSNSTMKLLSRSPWHWKNRVPVDETRPMLCGSLAHCAQFEPDAVEARYVFVPDDAPRRPTDAQWNAVKSNESSQRAKDWWREFEASQGGRSVILPKEHAMLKLQMAALKANDEISEAFSTGDSEVSMFWVDPKTGVYCKGRPDHVHKARGGRVVMVDLKALADDTPSGVQRYIARMGLYRQQAHYMRGFEVITRKPVDDFFFAVVSSVPPVLAMPHRITFEALEHGFEEVDELLAEFAQCQKSQCYPAYKPEQRMHSLPAWLKTGGEVEVEFEES